MKFFCTKEKLERSVRIAEQFTGKQAALPILLDILFEQREATLTISATNLEYAVELIIQGSQRGEGRICVPAKIISSLLQSIKEGKVEIESKQDNLFLSTPIRTVRMSGHANADFPLIPKIKEGVEIRLPMLPFIHALERVLPAVSLSEFKPELNGVFLRASPTRIVIAATDTFRLAESTLLFEKKESAGSFSCILPSRVVHELTRIYTEEGEIRILGGENQIFFESGGVKVTSRTIEGNFPDYERIIPKTFETSCFLSREEIAGAVRSAAIFSSKIQDIQFLFHPKEVEVFSINPDVGESKISLPTALQGKEAHSSFNYRYFLDGLGSLKEEEIFMGLNGESGPALLRNKSDTSFFYLLMPIRRA
jgi:DNA polymerase-3 subunit beta